MLENGKEHHDLTKLCGKSLEEQLCILAGVKTYTVHSPLCVEKSDTTRHTTTHTTIFGTPQHVVVPALVVSWLRSIWRHLGHLGRHLGVSERYLGGI